MKVHAYPEWNQHISRFDSLTVVFDSRNGDTHCLDELSILALEFAKSPIEKSELVSSILNRLQPEVESEPAQTASSLNDVIVSLIKTSLLEKSSEAPEGSRICHSPKKD